MDTKVKERKTDQPVAKATGTESHYHSKKDRVFVRGIQGQYSLKDELKRLRSMPRVRKGKELKFVDGPQTYSRHYVEPKDGISQMFHLHLEEYAPGAKSQKHGHVNEAAFYILDGAHEHAVLLAVIVRLGTGGRGRRVLRWLVFDSGVHHHNLSPASSLTSISCWNSGGPKPKRSPACS